MADPDDRLRVLDLNAIAGALSPSSRGKMADRTREGTRSHLERMWRRELEDPDLTPSERATAKLNLDQIARDRATPTQAPLNRYSPLHRALMGSDSNPPREEAVLAYGTGAVRAAGVGLVTRGGQRRLVFELPPGQNYVIYQQTDGPPSGSQRFELLRTDSFTSTRHGVYSGSEFANTAPNSRVFVIIPERDSTGQVVMDADGRPRGQIVAQFSSVFSTRHQELTRIHSHYSAPPPSKAPAPSKAP